MPLSYAIVCSIIRCAAETDKSVGRSKDKSPVKRTPAKKKRACKISSDSDGGGSGSSSSSDSSSNSDSSSSEDEAMAKDKVIDKSEEEQLRVLEEKRAAHKRLKSRMRKKATRSLIRKARRYEATLRKFQETEKEAEETEAEQQEEEAAEAEADLAATEWEGRNRKERSIKRIVRERHIEDRLGKPAPPAAGETSAAVADKAEQVCRSGKPAPPAAGETSMAVADSAERLCRLAGYKIPRRVSPIRKCYLESFETLPTTLVAASSGPPRRHRRDSCSGSWWTQAWCCLASRPRTTSGHTSNSRGERTTGNFTATSNSPQFELSRPS